MQVHPGQFRCPGGERRVADELPDHRVWEGLFLRRADRAQRAEAGFRGGRVEKFGLAAGDRAGHRDHDAAAVASLTQSPAQLFQLVVAGDQFIPFTTGVSRHMASEYEITDDDSVEG